MPKLSTLTFALLLSAAIPFAAQAQTTGPDTTVTDQSTTPSTPVDGTTDTASQPSAPNATMDEDQARMRDRDDDDSGKMGLLGLLGLAGLLGLRRRDRERDVTIVRGDTATR
jgi:MYXO-CTERM domain-containing protein